MARISIDPARIMTIERHILEEQAYHPEATGVLTNLLYDLALAGKVIATDISPDAVEAAKKNAATAGVEQCIEFCVCNFSDTPLPGSSGVIVMNPEYGERMGEVKRLEATYKDIGDYFKQKCRGYTGYVFTGSPDLAKKVSLKPKRTFQFFNSGIECRLLEYELYEGTRKFKKPKLIQD